MKNLFSFFLIAISAVTYGQTDSAFTIATPIHQLRIYELNSENASFFHERFKVHAQRIMKKYNFNIVAIWQSKSENKLEFIYLLQWKNESEMKSAWSRFMADQEWKDIKAETSKARGVFVNNISERTLFLTDYSPGKGL